MRSVTRLWLPLIILITGIACSESGGDEPDNASTNSGDRTGCIESASLLAGDVTVAPGVAAEDILEVVRSEHTAALTWPDGAATEIAFAASEAQAFLVKSRPDPNYLLNDAAQCADRVVVKTRARVTTADGKFAVDVPELQLELHHNKWLVGVSNGMPKNMLRGSYAATAAPETKCLHFTSVHVTLSLSQALPFRGELSNIVGDVPCGKKDPLERVTERTGAKW